MLLLPQIGVLLARKKGVIMVLRSTICHIDCNLEYINSGNYFLFSPRMLVVGQFRPNCNEHRISSIMEMSNTTGGGVEKAKRMAYTGTKYLFTVS